MDWSETYTTESVVDSFNRAFNEHDVDAAMALMTEDCIFESTGPAPAGQRYTGHEQVRKCWEHLFASAPNAEFSSEEIISIADRCVVRWRYDWGDGYVRGVDVFKVRDGKVAEKLAYVKG